jgi:hypothetical protein
MKRNQEMCSELKPEIIHVKNRPSKEPPCIPLGYMRDFYDYLREKISSSSCWDWVQSLLLPDDPGFFSQDIWSPVARCDETCSCLSEL